MAAKDDKLQAVFKKDIKEKRELINITLDRFLPRKDEYPKEIHKAQRYTLFAGGKRLRPYLCLQSFLLFSDDIDLARPVAGAIELLHTYTLIHDDLPEIDNDDLRRGRKTCHVVYGPALALLAGDSLISYAFDLLASCEVSDSLKVELIRQFARETGACGVVGGQMKDIISEGKKITKKELQYIHDNKTGKLIRLPLRFGAIVAGASEDDVNRLDRFGEKIGLAFQIADDILDIEGSKDSLGKSIGKDAKTEKATYPALYGLEKSKAMAAKLIKEAKALLQPYGEKALHLELLADYIISRNV
ncbi:MAG: geranylgeranyl pyrophosphate synthase [Candidatus Cloacimonadota bacterium]|nr:MAG: geranylgeranyl pyrophosphate synthase [Candidatus Cloacimonadota bacterium]